MEWLRACVEAKAPGQAQAAVWRLLHYDHQLQIYDPALKDDGEAFTRWRSCLSVVSLQQKVWTRPFLEVAIQESKLAEAKAARLAATRFQEWIKDGPGQGSKRQHLLSRAASGWIHRFLKLIPSSGTFMNIWSMLR